MGDQHGPVRKRRVQQLLIRMSALLQHAVVVAEADHPFAFRMLPRRLRQKQYDLRKAARTAQRCKGKGGRKRSDVSVRIKKCRQHHLSLQREFPRIGAGHPAKGRLAPHRENPLPLGEHRSCRRIQGNDLPTCIKDLLFHISNAPSAAKFRMKRQISGRPHHSFGSVSPPSLFIPGMINPNRDMTLRRAWAARRRLCFCREWVTEIEMCLSGGRKPGR